MGKLKPRSHLASAALLTSTCLLGCSVVINNELADKPTEEESRRASEDPGGQVEGESTDAGSLRDADASGGPRAPDAPSLKPTPQPDASVSISMSISDAGGASVGVQAKLCVGLAHGCALDPAGKITCWGKDDWFQQDLAKKPDSFVDVSCGDNHTCGVTSDGRILCVGSNTDRQTMGAPSETGFVQVAAGALHTCARKSDGRVSCWGASNSDTNEANAPKDTTFSALAVGDELSCGIKSEDGSLACWGNMDEGGTKVPIGIGFTKIAVGGGMGCAVDRAGKLMCWGEDADPPPPLLNVNELSVGEGGRGCARIDLELWCWDFGDVNKLGNTVAFASGPGGTCFLPADGGQLVCEPLVPNGALGSVPRPYPAKP